MDKTENTEVEEGTLSRRKALGRIGLLAAAAYTVPAFTTLSMARASSGSSSTSQSEPSQSLPSQSEPSISEPSISEPSISEPSSSGPSVSVPSEVEDICREFGTIEEEGYVQCLFDNKDKLPDGFQFPDWFTPPVL